MPVTDDFTADTSTAGVLQAGGLNNGSFEAGGDSDWFRIALAANSYYTFDLNAPSLTSYSGSLWLSLYSPVLGSMSALNSSSTSQGATVTFKTGAAGDYYLAAANSTYSAAMPYAYTVKASSAVADDVGDTLAGASALVLGQTATGAFEGPSDVDVYTVALQAGVSYTLKPVWLKEPVNSKYLMQLSVADANGVGQTLFSPAEYYSFTAGSTGTYSITARGSSSNGTASSYTLQASAAADDYSANVAGAGALAVGGTAIGKLEVLGDKDWYAVSLQANTPYWFSVKSSGSAGSAGNYNGTAQLKVLDGGEHVLASVVSSVNGSPMPFTPAKAGTYYFEVSDGYTSSTSTGNYLASVVVGQRDDHGGERTTATALAVGKTVAGKLEVASDLDMFKVPVKAGSTYVFELKQQAAQDNPSLVLVGQDANGSSANLASHSRPDTLAYRVYTADYTGDYFLTVDNSYGNGTASYTLQVSAPLDDYLSNTSTSGVLAMGGKVGGVMDYTGDVDWIKVALVAGNSYAFVLDGSAAGGGTLDWTNGGASMTIGTGKSGYEYFYLNSMNGLAGKGYTFRCDSTGDYYLAVSANSYYGTGTGSYTVASYNVSGDTRLPAVVGFAPANGAAGASLTGDITLTFDDMIRLGDGTIRLIDAMGNAVESFSNGYSATNMNITGKTLTLNPSANLQAGMKYMVEIQAGSLLDFAGNKFLPSALYTFTTVASAAQGTDANDYLSGTGVNVRLDGGAGVDTAVFGSVYGNYTVTRSGGETKVLLRGGGSTVGDTLTNVERLQFSDRSIGLDADGHGGQAYRLYQAAFNRAPDKVGLGYWMARLDQGDSLKTAADAFLGSSEFQAGQGANSSDAAYINYLYKNVLHRDIDAEGAGYWLGKLAIGASRADLLVGFSDSAENQAEAMKLIGNGFEYTPYG